MQVDSDDGEDRVRQLADRLNFITEEDFRLLAGATVLTVEAWRKRNSGPPVVRLGTRYLYPMEGVSKWLAARVREGATVRTKDML